jgi:hypothetical protein
MKKLGLLCVLLLLSVGLFALTATANHQVQLNVNEVAVLALNSTATITLEITPPVVAGDEPQGDTDATKLLRYTSLVPDSTTRRMTVAWGALDVAPNGTELAVEITNVLPTNCGTAVAGGVVISDTAQDIITGIGSGRTGSNAGDGAVVSYAFNITDLNALDVGDNHLVTVTYTLTDAS